jgi:hypothetical protein
MAGWQLVRRGLFLLGIALCCLLVFALFFALSIRTGIAVPFRWVMLGLFTGILVYSLVKTQRQYWRRIGFWLVCLAAIVTHLAIFVPLLSMYPNFRPIWLIPAVVAEAAFFGSVSDLLLRDPKASGKNDSA